MLKRNAVKRVIIPIFLDFSHSLCASKRRQKFRNDHENFFRSKTTLKVVSNHVSLPYHIYFTKKPMIFTLTLYLRKTPQKCHQKWPILGDFWAPKEILKASSRQKKFFHDPKKIFLTQNLHKVSLKLCSVSIRHLVQKIFAKKSTPPKKTRFLGGMNP